jgi:hypothetical protein
MRSAAGNDTADDIHCRQEIDIYRRRAAWRKQVRGFKARSQDRQRTDKDLS